MLVYEEIVDEIRATLTAETDPSAEQMQHLDDRYGQAVTEVNHRLRECSDLLDKGLRTEAIQKCESDPNLLEIVAVLDLPELEVWADYSKQFGLPGPPRVQSAIAEQLNDAYNEESSLGDLLREHRKHALAKSPLSTRLNILRKLAHRDSGTPIWQEDVKQYEIVRHNELAVEISAALAKEDLPALAELEREVSSQVWQNPPPSGIKESAIGAHTRVRVKTARAKLTELVDELTAANSELDVQAGRRLRSRWQAQAAIAQLDDMDTLSELVAPALNWLDEADRIEAEDNDFQATIDELEKTLDEEGSLEDIERLRYQALTFDRELSPVLTSRVEERIHALQVADTRRGRLISTAVVLMILMAGGAMAWSIMAYQQRGVIDAHATAIRELNESRNIEQAKEYLQKLQTELPTVFAHASVQTQASETNRLNIEETARRNNVTQLIEGAEKLGESWDGYGPALSNLSKAEEMSKSQIEKTEIVRVRQKVEKTRSDKQEEIDLAFTQELTTFGDEIRNVDAQDVEAMKRIIDQGKLLANRPRVTRELLQQIAPLIERMEAKKKTEESMRSEFELIEAIDYAIGSRTAYRRALRKYINDYPQKPQTQSFAEVLDRESKVWDGIDFWNGFLERNQPQDYRSVTCEIAKDIITRSEEIIEKHPGFPAQERLQEVIKFLRPVTQRIDNNNDPSYVGLTNKIDKNIPDLNMVLKRGGRTLHRYFFKRSDTMQLNNGSFRIYHFIDTGFDGTRAIRLEPNLIANGPESTDDAPTYDWTAPQTRFRQAALDLMSDFNESKWEEGFYRLILNLDDLPQMAPQVRVQLLQLILQEGCRGSLPMQLAYQSHLQQLNSTNISEEPLWVDPDNVAGQSTASKSSELLSRLGFRTLERNEPEKSHREAAKETVAELNKMKAWYLGKRHAWVGIIRTDSQSNWVFVPKKNIRLPDADLWVVYPDDTGTPQFEIVGQVTSGTGKLNTQAPGGLLAGRPVFIATR